MSIKSMDQESVSAKGKLKSSGNGTFDKLPDELLIRMHSEMNVKEAIKMSVLAHRWEHLWKDAKTFSFDLRDAEKENFLASVDAVVKHHKGSIEGMTIMHHLGEEIEDYDPSTACAVERLIHFAVDREIQRWYVIFKFVVLASAVYSIRVTPLEFGFFRGLHGILLGLDIIVHGLTLVDIIIKFIVPYPDFNQMVYYHRLIALRFLSFLIVA